MDEMTILTKKQILDKSHISDDEIKQDIKDTQDEIDIYRKELEILMKNPVENKADIYMREGRISSRQHFINQLKEILEYRLKSK